MGEFTAFRRSVYRARVFPNFPAPPSSGTDPEPFSLDVARTLIWAAQLAYEVEDAAKAKSIMADWGWQLLSPLLNPPGSLFESGLAKGYVAAVNGATIVSFAGTEPEEIKSWLINLLILGAAAGQHQGYFHAANDALSTIAPRLADTTGPIYFCGHSLGGAVAALAAFRYLELRPEDSARLRAVYTIGMPRPGNAEFAALYNARLGQRTFRLVHGEDIVPTVPPNIVPFNYRHVGRALHFPRNGMADPAALDETPHPEPSQGLEDLLAFRDAIPIFDLNAKEYPAARSEISALAKMAPARLRDHFVDQYLRGLGAL